MFNLKGYLSKTALLCAMALFVMVGNVQAEENQDTPPIHYGYVGHLDTTYIFADILHFTYQESKSRQEFDYWLRYVYVVETQQLETRIHYKAFKNDKSEYYSKWLEQIVYYNDGTIHKNSNSDGEFYKVEGDFELGVTKKVFDILKK